ncbi:MAG: hypothetical protein ACYSTL_03305, partial [Planctomycetota bacterium]
MTQQTTRLEETILQRLFAAAQRSKDTADADDKGAVEYDWSAPQHFTRTQMEQINLFAESTAKAISKTLSSLMHSKLEMQNAPVTQHRGDERPDDVGGETDYSVCITSAASEVCGRIVLPGSWGGKWAAKMLGSAGFATENRELSPAENALLVDMMGSVIKALSNTSKAAGGEAFSIENQITKGQFVLSEKTGSEFTRIT